MQANTERAFSSYDSGIVETVNTFVESVTTALERAELDSQSIEEIKRSGEQVAQVVGETIEQQSQEIDDLEQELQQTQEHSGKERAELSSRISELEEEQDNSKEQSSTDNPKGEREEKTNLERVCELPEQVVEDNLTVNQQRARSVARRIDEYGKSVPAGIAITSSRIKRVLTAQEDTTIHRQTVKRVADFLKRFGDGDVKVKETSSGKTTVVFDEQLAKDVTGVVTESTGGGVTQAVV